MNFVANPFCAATDEIMALTPCKEVDEYIAAQPAEVRRLLKSVRSTIRKAVPAAEEVISYQIPAYKLNGRVLIYFAGWKEHYALYPITAPLSTALKRDFARYELSGRGTVRLPLSEPVPVKLIERIVKFRAQEVAEAAKARGAKAAARKKN